MIIGADHYHKIILPNLKKVGTMVAQETTLGWIVSGSIQPTGQLSTRVTYHISHTEVKDLNNQLKKFWEVESMQRDGRKTDDDVEQKFKSSM
jgi:hypothetical protein